MPPPSIQLALAALGGALLGFTSAALWLGHSPPPDALEHRSRGAERERRSVAAGEPGGQGTSAAGDDDERPGGARRATEAPEPERADAAIDAERQARARELAVLRARERAARDELAKARARITGLEEEVEAERAPRPARTRHEYDLTPEDWKQMAAQGQMKYRVPCTGTGSVPADGNLAQLGLAPDDYPIVREALASSVSRQREALLPICAAALDGQPEVARSLNVDSCLTIIFSTASRRGESPKQSAHNVAAFMAGDAPRPENESALTERAFLALAGESKRVEDDLAAAFGPEEAHRITFSDALCFGRSSFSYGARPERDRE